MSVTSWLADVTLAHFLAQDREELALLRLGIDPRHGALRIGHAEELEHHRQQLAEALVGKQQPPGDLLAHGEVGIGVGDAIVVTERLQHRHKGNVLAMRDRAAHRYSQSARTAAFEKLETQAALAGTRRGDDADDLAVTGARLLQCGVEGLHVGVAADEARESARARDLEPRAQRAQSRHLVNVDRLADAFDPGRAERLEREIALDEACAFAR